MKLKDYKLWTALITPLSPGLEVDYHSLENLIKEQVKAKNGLLILGSTGEALNLSIKARKDIVNFVISLNTKLPLMIGVGGHNLSDQKNWLKWLESKQIDAYLMVTPIYSKPNDQGQYEWFKILMDSVTRPVILYNVPGRAAKELSYNAVKKLSTHPNFWGIKEASGSVIKMKEYIRACQFNKNKSKKEKVFVFCGDDGLMSEFAQAGSCGLISVASNTWPSETNLYMRKCLDNTINNDNDSLVLWKKASESLFVASNPIPAKVLLEIEKRITSRTLMPPLSAKDMKNEALLNNYSQQIKQWFKNKK